MNFPELITERLLLRKVLTSDKEMIFKGLSNPEITRHLLVHLTNIKDAEKQLEFYENHWQQQTGIFWAAEEKQSSQLAGVVGIYDINTDHRRAEIGYWLLPEFHGKGFIKEAGETILDYSFKQFGLNRIYAQIIEGNLASRSMMQKLGFTQEGVMREYEISREGAFANLVIYSRLKSDSV